MVQVSCGKFNFNSKKIIYKLFNIFKWHRMIIEVFVFIYMNVTIQIFIQILIINIIINLTTF